MQRIKLGDTFKLSAVVKGDGVPLDITGWTIASEMRTASGALVDSLITTVTDAAAGEYTLEESAAGVTADWPTGELHFDIKYTISGVVSHTDTIHLTVEKQVTQ